LLLCLQLLESHHVRFSFRQPSQKIVEPLIDVVNVEGGDFQRVPFRGSSVAVKIALTVRRIS